MSGCADPDAGGQRHGAAHVSGLRPQGPGPLRRDIGGAGGVLVAEAGHRCRRSSACPKDEDLLNTIRAKTMKRGGVGYVQPDSGSFPLMADTNRFILAAGGMPVHTWLDGTSDGEQAIEELLDVAMSTGAVALNVIPGPQLHAGLAGPEGEEPLPRRRSGPAASPRRGRRHRDEQPRPEVRGRFQHAGAGPPAAGLPEERLHRLRPFGAPAARAASAIPVRGRTSTSPRHERKNAFFEEVGATLKPGQEDVLAGLNRKASPDGILKKVRA